MRSRSPTPVGVGLGGGGARQSGESGGSTTRVGDDSLVVVSNTPSPSSHLGVGSRHAKSKKSFDGSLAGVFGRDKDGHREREREKEERKVRGAGDRSSFFGNGMSLGRSRKPAPRYSLYVFFYFISKVVLVAYVMVALFIVRYEAEAAAAAGTLPSDKHRSISRYITSTIGFGSISGNGVSGGAIIGGGGKKKSSRPGTAPSGNGINPAPFGQRSNVSVSPISPEGNTNIYPFGAAKDDTHLVRSSSPVSPITGTVLRKRHVSTTASVSPSSPGVRPKAPLPLNASTKADKVDFQVGLSVLDQIGQPDYAGWLKKKGEKYNAWKTRYLVLKGPHLYYLKDADRMVSFYALSFAFFFKYLVLCFSFLF